MKIGFIVDNYRAIFRFRVALLRQRYGVDNVVVAEWFTSSQMYNWEQQPNPECENDCISFSRNPHKYERQFVNPGQILLKANHFLRKNKVGVCFIHGYFPNAPMEILAACLINRIPSVLMADTHRLSATSIGVRHFIKKAIVKRFSAALVGGPSQVPYYEELGIRKGRVFYGLDVVDNKYFTARANVAKMDAQETRKRLGLPRKYFLNLGRMVKKKNLSSLVKAYAIARKSSKMDADLVFVGSGECEDDLKRQALCLGLAVRDTAAGAGKDVSGVCFFHHQPSDDLPSFYSLAEAFVLPSQSEEWGLVVNEAMACGAPVIVSSVCGCAPDLVHHGINGFQFDHGNPEELAGRLIEIAAQPDLARKMGQCSFEIISKWDRNFFLGNVERAIESVYSHSKQSS